MGQKACRMFELSFQIEGAEVVPFAASPLLNLKTRIRATDSELCIHNILLQCQVQIEPTRRPYIDEEKIKLQDLFGDPIRWGQTLRPILWSNVNVVVPSFACETLANIPVPCTFDFNIASTKYLYGLEGGEIPICVFFSGTVFYANAEGFRLTKIPWDREAKFRLPVPLWKEMMEMYYPNASWVCLQRDVFDQIYRYKTARGIPTWEQTFEKLLASGEESELRKVDV